MQIKQKPKVAEPGFNLTLLSYTTEQIGLSQKMLGFLTLVWNLYMKRSFSPKCHVQKVWNNKQKKENRSTQDDPCSFLTSRGKTKKNT